MYIQVNGQSTVLLLYIFVIALTTNLQSYHYFVCEITFVSKINRTNKSG